MTARDRATVAVLADPPEEIAARRPLSARLIDTLYHGRIGHKIHIVATASMLERTAIINHK